MRNASQETRPKTERRAEAPPPQPDESRVRASWTDRLFEPVRIAPLVYFRIAFGLVLLWSVSMFFNYRGFDMIARYFIEPGMHFTYPGFGWVKPLPGNGMYVVFFVLGLAAALLATGLAYRAAAAVYFLGFTYVFLLEQTRYMNHYYLICLVSLLMAFVPANRACSVDALLRPAIRSQTAPAWTLWLLRAQFGIVYFYAGLAKCHREWLDGTIMLMKFGRQEEFPVLGPLLTEHASLAVAAAWFSLLFDLLVFPALLWRKTRIPALAAALFFHLMNAQLFNIDVFPWLMIAATVILFFPDWLPWRGDAGRTESSAEAIAPSAAGRRWTLALLGAYLAVQLLFPLRHVAYHEDGDWTEEGQQFAWRMLMREKYALPPRFPVSYRKNGQPMQGELPVPFPRDEAFWTGHWMFRKMAINPDMILQFCHHWADIMRADGCDQIDIRADVKVSLNGREPRPLIDPSVNLAEEPRRWVTPYPWILPLRDSGAEPPRGANWSRGTYAE